MRDRHSLAAKVAAVQEPLLDAEAVRSTFSDNEIQHLRAVIRLAVEFQDYVERIRLDAIDLDELSYVSESIFAGVDSFLSVAGAYKVLVGATSSRIAWATMAEIESPQEFRTYYFALYERFSAEASFENKCGILLDLFKLQLLFVAIMYNW